MQPPNLTGASRPSERSQKRRVLLVAGISFASMVAALAFVVLTVATREKPGSAIAGQSAADSVTLAAVRQQSYLLYLRSNGDTYRRVSLRALEGEGAAVLPTELLCQRVDFEADRGLCLGEGSNPLGASADAVIFDSSFNVQHRIDFPGLPSRARISPDGRYGAVTVFVTGHSYSQAGFSTRTAIIDMDTGELVIDSLEDFTVMRDGRCFSSIDFNFWGVTFTKDRNRFYATLGSGGKTYLIEGNVATREARVLKENVECPSLSPDESRIVFKKRFTHGILQQVEWQLYALDLRTMEERPLSEARNVDDQVEWLDDVHVVYFLRDEGAPRDDTS